MWFKSVLLLAVLLNVQLLDASVFRTGYGFDRVARRAPLHASMSESKKIHRLGLLPPLVQNKPQPHGSIRVRRLHTEMKAVKDVVSYTMFVTTNQSCNANMFGWFFKHPVSCDQSNPQMNQY
jgi:hypothetical protein